MLERLLRPLASLRIAVTLLALIVLLIFFGSLAQRFQGIWFVLEAYFKQPVVWVDLKIFAPAGSAALDRLPFQSFPFLGGVTLGVAMLVNLLAAFVLKFRPTQKVGLLLAGAAVTAGGAALVAAGHLVPAWRQALGANAVNMIIGGLLLYTPVTVGFLLLYGKKGGLVMAHVSILLLILGQGIASYKAVETRAIIKEGQTATYTEDGREYELAVISPKTDGSGRDRVTLVAQWQLEDAAKAKTPIALPGGASVAIDRWFANVGVRISQAEKPDDTSTLPPMDGAPMLVGKRLELIEAPPVSGLGQAMENTPGALVRVDGKTYALHGNDTGARKVMGSDLSLQLRPRRHFLPYAIRLEKFSHDLYPGTSTPKNFSSRVTILETGKPEREVTISMNQPLRMPRETLFQASFFGEDTTVLQVVQNPGWTIPYIACALGAFGLLVHFMISLGKFLKKNGAASPGARVPSPANPAGGSMPPAGSLSASDGASGALSPARACAGGDTRAPVMGWLLPTLAAGVCVVALLGISIPRPIFAVNSPSINPSADAVAALPVVAGGRVQPLDSLARNSLLTLSGRSSLRLPGKDGKPTRTLSAVEWLLDAMAKPETADTYPVFQIDHDEVKALIGQKDSLEKRFAMAQILPHFKDLGPGVEDAHKTPREARDARQHALVELEGRINLYAKLRGRAAMLAITPPHTDDARAPGGWLPLPDALATLQQQGWATSAQVADWAKTLEAWQASAEGSKELQAQVDGWGNLLAAWEKNDTAAFNAAAGALQKTHAAHAPSASSHARVETWFNAADPFYAAVWIYVCAALAVFFSWAFWQKPLWRTAYALVGVAFLVHVLALVVRIWISGRPPVTNLYSSAVFVGCGLAGFALVAELILAYFLQLRLGFALLVGAVAGAGTLLIAKALAADGDTLAVLQAVLDTNFWLATHVVVITLGYSATFLAGLLGMVALGYGALAPEKKHLRHLTTLIYGTICFALIFSFVGTILGGIWADQSWGRFWGWDPKENGAMMIVLWNALILHARVGGLVKDRGLAVLAVFGNIVTAWSWFGVNQLGAGLHSYGFTNGAVVGIVVFVAVNLGAMGLGWVPQRRPKA